MVLTKSLCERCQNLFSTSEGLQALIGPDGYKHHNEADLYRSAQAGCLLCSMISNACKNEGILFRNSDERIMIYDSWGPPERSQKYLDMDKHPLLQQGLPSLIITTDIQGMHLARLATLANFDSAASRYIEGRPIALDMSSAAVVEPVKKILEECLLHHAKCPRTRSSQAFQPSRVIDVGVIGSDETPYVHIPDKMKANRYVALSYCWGGPQEVMTIVSTLENHLRQLPMHQMPQTIKDAITMTRNLGIRYLWIDALCIVQDSDEDKAAELSNMGQIYKNATLTIAATCSQSAREGFLWQRQPPRSCQVDLLLPNGDYAEMFVSESVFEEDSRPLDNRGWAFQESTLSPRLLIYGTMDVSWRCSTQTFQTICGAVNERFIPTPRSLPELFDDRLSRPAEKGQNQAWRNLMVDYTPRSLTFPSDRLSAIAGVAAEFGKLFNDEYLAGMWRKTLRTDLGWYRSDREGYMKCQNFGLGLAPSWSWAKIEQGFIDNNAITDPDIEVIRTEIEWLPIQNGTIAAKGCLHVRGIIINMSDIVRNRPIGFEQFMDEENGAASSDAKCLYLGSTFGPHKAIGLLIEPVDGSKYRRVGRVSIQAERTSPLSEKFFSIWGQPGARTETIVLI